MQRRLLNEIRAGVWAAKAVRSARRQLKTGAEINQVRLEAVPKLSSEAEGGVRQITRRLDATCLERAVVLQRWHAAHGRKKALVVGVTPPSSGFRAHAWLEGEDQSERGFVEFLRYDPP